MGLLDFFRKKEKEKSENKKKKSDFRKAMEDQKSERTVSIQKSESLNIPKEEIYSPTFEHPLLTMQDKLVRIEELYRSLNERVEKQLATKEDVRVLASKEDVRVLANKEDLKDIEEKISESLEKSESIIGGLDNLERKIGLLEQKKQDLSERIDSTTYELTKDLGELEEVEKTINLLEADKKILDILKSKKLSTIELSEELGYTRQYLWGRLKRMQDQDLVESFKEGRQTKYRTKE